MTRATHLLLAGLLALTACSTGTTPVRPPATVSPNPAATFGLFELNMNRNKTATVQQVTAQATTEIPFDQLTFTRVNMTNLVDDVNKVVHMTATFRVVNNTGSTINLPTFIPVDTAGTYATDSTSAFRNVRTRTGVPVTSAGMAVEVAHTSTGGIIAPDPAATPFLTNIDSGTLTLSLPDGTTAPNVAHRGWQSTSLVAGGDQLVTFAARVPLQGTEITDADPFSFSLVFAVADTPGTVTGLRGIHEVQGSTPSGNAASPLNSQSVTVEGVVTSVHTANVTGSLKGFFVQEETVDTDGIGSTSEGLFVYCNTSCPSVTTGDRVRVTGTVSEFAVGTDTQTQITTTAASVLTLSSNAPLPEAQPLTLPLPVTSREQYEGMRVSASGVVTNNYTLGRGASFDIAQQRIMNFTQLNAPSVSGYATFKAGLPEKTIRIDDGTRAQNPDPVIFARGQQNLSATNTLRGGDNVTATGVLTFSNDGWTGSGSVDTFRIHATQLDVNITDGNPRLNAPESVNGDTDASLVTRVGAMNVLNYFTTLSVSNTGCTPNGFNPNKVNNQYIMRGANTCEEFVRQQTKIVEAISGLNPDVLGLMEMQNDFDKGATSSVANLVDALNAKAGAGTYAYINPGANVGTDAISLAMIYKPAAVTPVGNLAILDNTFDPAYADTCNRPTWAQTFQKNSNLGRFTAVMMHLKSKGTACGATSDADQNDGQGNGYIARRNAATAIVNWLNTNPTGIVETDRILMGDYNAYASEEPLTILETGGYANLFNKNVYSYQFDGQWGSLDQATGSASLAAQVTGKTKWHINADEPTVLDYNTEFKTSGQISGETGSFYALDAFRSSDHDPILIGLNLTADQPLVASVNQTPDTATQTVTVGGASVTQSFTSTLTNATGALNVTVTPVGGAPSIVSAPTTATSGTPFNVTIQAPAGTATGTYEYTVTTTNNGVSDSSTLTVTVNPAPVTTVTLTPSTASQTVTVNGASATQSYTASGTNLSGALTVTVTPVGSAPAIVSAPATATDGTPFDVTIQAPTGTAAGTYTYTVTAANNGQSSSSTLTVTVNPAPSITLSGANKSVVTGATTTTTVTVTRTNFTGDVNLSVTSVNGSGTAPSVTVASQPGTGTSASLSINAAGATVGSYTVTLQGSGTGISDATTTLTVTVAPVPAPVNHLVISQAHGGGGNSGATYKNDFIELFNPTSGPLSLNGLFLQYASATGTFTGTPLALPNVSLGAGQYYLVQCAAGSNTGAAALPSPDLTTCNFAMGGTSFKVALTNSNVAVTSTVGSVSGGNIVDFLGAASNQYEGTAAPAPSNTLSVQRAANGCMDTDQNGNDFATASPAPRSLATTPNICSVP